MSESNYFTVAAAVPFCVKRSSKKESWSLRWKFRIRRRVWIHKVPRCRYSFQPEVPPTAGICGISGRKSALLTFTWGKMWEISVLCKIQCGWNIAKHTMRSLRPGVRFIRCYLLNPWSQRESPLYTLSHIISRTVGTSLLRFILRKSLVQAWQESANCHSYLFTPVYA